MAERYEHLEKAIQKELDKLDQKYTPDVELSEQDLERAYKLLKTQTYADTHAAMKAEEEMRQQEMRMYSEGGRPMRRMNTYGSMPYIRNMSDGRATRDMIHDGYSGHRPMDYYDMYPDWRF